MDINTFYFSVDKGRSRAHTREIELGQRANERTKQSAKVQKVRKCEIQSAKIGNENENENGLAKETTKKNNAEKEPRYYCYSASGVAAVAL